MAAKWIETLTGSLEQKKQYKQDKARIDALPEPYAHRREGDAPVLHVLRRHHRRRHPRSRCSATSPTCGSAPPSTGRPSREIVGDDPVEFAETFAQAYTGKQWIDKERARLNKAIDDAEREEQK